MQRRRDPAGIVQGQNVTQAKLDIAKQMRHGMTPEERILWNEVRSNRLGGFHFRRQQVISGYVVDFYCDAARVAVELDGAGHDSEYDAHRDRELARVSVQVLRFANATLRHDLHSVLDQILKAVRERT